MRSTEAVLGFLRDTGIGCTTTLMRTLEEEDGKDSESKEGGPSPP